MLNTPYKKIADRGDTNYYLLQTEDSDFLAIESNAHISETETIQQGINVLPLHYAIVMSMALALDLHKVGEETLPDYDEKEDGELGKVEYFEIMDIKNLRRVMYEKTLAEKNKVSRFDYHKVLQSKMLKLFVEEGKYQTLMIEQLDSRVRKAWLVKSDKFGKLTLQCLLLAGKNASSEKLIALQTFVVDRPLMETVLKALLPEPKPERELTPQEREG